MPTDDRPLFTVTYQREVTNAPTPGVFQKGVQVGFQTRSGAQGSLFFAEGDYNAASVEQALTARAQEMERIASIGK